MGVLALVLGILGFLSAVMGIITAVGVVPAYAGLEWLFWLILSGVLLLACIASAIARSSYE